MAVFLVAQLVGGNCMAQKSVDIMLRVQRASLQCGYSKSGKINDVDNAGIVAASASTSAAERKTVLFRHYSSNSESCAILHLSLGGGNMRFEGISLRRARELKWRYNNRPADFNGRLF